MQEMHLDYQIILKQEKECKIDEQNETEMEYTIHTIETVKSNRYNIDLFVAYQKTFPFLEHSKFSKNLQANKLTAQKSCFNKNH